MKNIFYILLLLPTIIFAQYPSNSGQKITLGEQTTADGLVFRGVASIDTVTATSKITRANKQDTSAYILLDTVTNLLWHYKIGSNAWTQAGGGVSVSSFSAGTTGLTPSTATTGAVTLGGTLGGGNGGTGITTFGAVGRIPYASSTTVLTTNSNLLYDGTRLRTNQVAIGDTASNTVGITNLLSLSGGSGAGFTLKSSYDSPILRSFTFLINALGNVGFWNNNLSSYAYFIQNSDNYLGVGNTSPTERLHVVGNARITGNIGAGIDVAQARLHVKGSGVTNSSTALKVDNSGNTNLLTVLDDGNVGIGTASPTSATWGKFIQVEATYPGLILNSTASGGVKYSIGADASTLLFRDETTAASRMVITSGGNVGIGRTSPTAKLDVNGDIKFKNNLSGEITSSGAQIVFYNNANQPFWINMQNNNNTGRFICGVEGAAGATFTYSSANSAFFGSNAGDLHIISDGAIRQTIKSTGNVGIGTTSPSGVLEVAGTSANTDFRISRTVSSSTYFYIKAPGGSPSTATMGVNGVDVMALNASGNVGIGTISPAVQFHTTGGVRFAGLASITDLRTDANGDLFNGSDFNLKNSIDTINFGLSDVLKLKPVSFNWNDEQRNINEYKSMGFIAQDVMNIIPNAASTMGDGDMQVDYNAIVATLTKAIQEQNALIKALEQRIINLENK